MKIVKITANFQVNDSLIAIIQLVFECKTLSLCTFFYDIHEEKYTSC